MTIANPYAEMLGRTIVSAAGWEKGSDRATFTAADGSVFTFCHLQDCCESVEIVDVAGDISELFGSPLVLAEEVSSEDAPPPHDGCHDSYTWTFYKFATANGYVTVRWLGESNGYYSESVDYSEQLCPRAA